MAGRPNARWGQISAGSRVWTGRLGAADWWRHATFYQIYPRSFADSDGDGIGDLRGIAGRLDHLEWLGVDAIWLSPFYPSPQADYGYDVTDHCAVDPVFGTLDDFDRLVSAAHGRGIRVVVDLVLNHTSDRHQWFVESRASRVNPRRDWYVWREPGRDGGEPNNWLSAFDRCGAAWTRDEATGQYYLHSYTPQQPDLNWANPRVRAAATGIARFWLERGVDGFRLDAIHRIGKDPELRDNPPEIAAMRRALHRLPVQHHNLDWPLVHDYLRQLRKVVAPAGDRVMVGEVGIGEPERLTRYYDELDLVFSFAFWTQPWNAEAFRAVVGEFASGALAGAWPTWTLGNHDIPRLATRLGADRRRGRTRVAAMMLLTLRGTPFIYYGDEIGMVDGEVPGELAIDPDGRDACRTPMQWAATPNAGFSTGTPWLPVSPDPAATVAAQRADAGSLLNLYRRLIRLRREWPALTSGVYRAADGPPGVLVYERLAARQRLIVALNFTEQPVDLRSMGQVRGRLLLSTDPLDDGPTDTPDEVDLRWLGPLQGLVLQTYERRLQV